MMATDSQDWRNHVIRQEARLCLWLNQGCRIPQLKRFFAFISWLGDGKFWYACMLMPLLNQYSNGIYISLHMVVLGLISVVVYKLIKSGTARLRPYDREENILLGTMPLDKYSFPSGHTLHAAGFTLLIIHYMPELAAPVILFSVLVALSRIILGLHYPTDVFAGAFIGLGLAKISLFVL